MTSGTPHLGVLIILIVASSKTPVCSMPANLCIVNSELVISSFDGKSASLFDSTFKYWYFFKKFWKQTNKQTKELQSVQNVKVWMSEVQIWKRFVVNWHQRWDKMLMHVCYYVFWKIFHIFSIQKYMTFRDRKLLFFLFVVYFLILFLFL